MIQLLIADDHAVVRRGFIQIISGSPDMKVIAEAGTRDEVFAGARAHTLDAIVLDMNLGEASGLDVLKSLKAEFPKLPVLILSVFPEDQFAVRMLQAGASGYMNKESEPEQLLDAIRRIVTGKRYVSQAVAEELLHRMESGAEEVKHESLSDRELQVMRFLASGKSVSDIADQLSISVKTVSTYRARVLEKMSFKNNAELTHYAVVNGLIF
jgi:DNA-binding NarL/FixJ family response regulator